MEDKPRAKQQILHLLKVQGAQTATTLAAQLQVSPMAVRQHLQTLQTEQQVTYQAERRALGRPVKLWQLTAVTAKLFPDSHADLTVKLLQDMQTVFGAEGLERLLVERTQRQVQTYRQRLSETLSKSNWHQQVGELSRLRSQEGYMAAVIEQADGSLLFVENPLSDLRCRPNLSTAV
ncbi:helix-turn-helix transcriptional regulator [Neosynechococcus sphagnicola]|uniref:helix-turn-helix transcriptional regulator n=1 Tax=Neosynechococcus sphagnicola TaxID=1501145 RepID=UPI000B1B554C|nr:HTH domain-containing protein [Neosynechococcus sphagnicola]